MTLSLLEMQLGWGDTLKTSGVGFVLVLIVLAFIAVLIMMISKVFNKVAGKATTEETRSEAPASISAVPTSPAASVTAPAAPVASGYLKLEGVSEANAAVIMALVSHQTGIPLNRLAFHSIKCLQNSVELIDVDEPTAAVIMAIVSDTSGIPLERLDFSSIRLIKEN